MTKDDHVAYWIKSAKKNLETVNHLFEDKQYPESLFFAHLTLEKLCKAIWVKHREENNPPRIHNLIRILELANVTLDDEQKDFFLMFNNFLLEGRYPDYKFELWKKWKKKNTFEVLKQFKQKRKWLLSKLQ